jgi:flagellar motor protein MotB
MAKKDCKCKKAAECEECPEWIFTFADLVMLMMGFFVILWVLKPTPTKENPAGGASEEWITVVASVREAFGYLPDPHSTDPVDLYMLLKKSTTQNQVKGPKLGSRSHRDQKSQEGTDPEVQSIRDGKHATVGGRLLFEVGQSTLLAQTRQEVDGVADLIRGHYTIVRIKGHTAGDDLPDDATPQQKMDLSLKRAQAVAAELEAHGVDPQTLRIEGCSIYEPINLRAYTPEAIAPNRRVEIDVTSTLVDERQGRSEEKSPQHPVASAH